MTDHTRPSSTSPDYDELERRVVGVLHDHAETAMDQTDTEGRLQSFHADTKAADRRRRVTWGISAASFKGEQAVQKNGWLARSSEGNRWIVNSTGRISGDNTDIGLSVLSHGHRSQQAGIAFVERIAAMTRSFLGW